MIEFIAKCAIAGATVIVTALVVLLLITAFRIAYERIKRDDERKHELLK